MKRGFTLVELVVAVAVLAIITSFASAVFSVSINTHRTATANAEVMQKLRAITDQLNADFSGLRKDGEIFVVWVFDPNAQSRFDRIMFFANGDFASYNDPCMRGNLARVSYMLSNKGVWGAPDSPAQFAPRQRILTRTQHILTQQQAYPDFIEPNQLTEPELDYWRNAAEADKTTLRQWKQMSWGSKKIALSVETDINVDSSDMGGGSFIDTSKPHSFSMYLCDGVGEFQIQGWYDQGRRWVPSLAAGDFDHLVGDQAPGILYPYPPFGAVSLGGEFYCDSTPEGWDKLRYLRSLLSEKDFNKIPGLGRALKFTFTLYDSKGIIKDGKVFTHIVYLDN